MKSHQTDGFLPLLRCPYCQRRLSEGLIAYDLDVLAAALGSWDETPVEQTTVRQWDHPRLVYDPDGVRNAPCEHLIAHLFDVAVFQNAGAVKQTAVSLFESYDHPWFGETGDHAQDHLHEFLWWTTNDGIRTAFDPESPSLVRRAWHTSQLGRLGWLYRVSGAAVYAHCADKFLEQLHAGYRRREELECP